MPNEFAPWVLIVPLPAVTVRAPPLPPFEAPPSVKFGAIVLVALAFVADIIAAIAADRLRNDTEALLPAVADTRWVEVDTVTAPPFEPPPLLPPRSATKPPLPVLM